MKYWNEKEKRLMTEAEMMEAKKAQETEMEAPSEEPAPNADQDQEPAPNADQDQEPVQDEKPKTSKKK